MHASQFIDVLEYLYISTHRFWRIFHIDRFYAAYLDFDQLCVFTVAIALPLTTKSFFVLQ